MKKANLFIACLLLTISIYAQSFDGIVQAVNRQFPFLKGKVIFRSLPVAIAHTDSARIAVVKQKLYIQATSPVAAAYAVNQFVQLYCHSGISHSGDNIQTITTLPAIRDTAFATQFTYRYALNYCTYNYTYSFYNWSDWERELDWMAFNGVNLMLAPVGTEPVWKKVLRSIGYTDNEINAFIPGPAFNAWWLMGNLQGWGGPVTTGMLQHWQSLQQKILQRMRQLGIQPVMQSFWGMVPSDLEKKYPGIKLIQQGKWAGGFQRPAFLSPEDPLFAKMAALYYTEMQRLYGKECKFFGGDLFHEGGSAKGIDVPRVAGIIQSSMQQYYPGSTWVLQGWQGNPRSDLLAGLDKQHTLIIDLMGETNNNWEKRDAYGHFPWIWCSINNWGGKTGMGALLNRVIDEPHRAYATSQGRYMKGIGIIPEGIKNNPVVYALALQTAWSDAKPPEDKWIADYISYRYGSKSAELQQAWQYLIQSLYGDYTELQKGATEAIFCARPDTNVTNVSTWGPESIQYNTALPEKALVLFYAAAKTYQHNAAYKYDLVDLTRQVVANKARSVYQSCMQAFKRKDISTYQTSRDQFLKLLMLQDSLLQTHADFMLGTWIAQARALGTSAKEKDLYEWNARTQITYWGADNPATNLHEYAHKEWAGLLKDFYLARWKVFFNALDLSLQNGIPLQPIDYFTKEKQWADAHNVYSAKPTGNTYDIVQLIIQTLKLAE